LGLRFRCHDLCGDGSWHGSAFSSTSGSRLTFQMASHVLAIDTAADCSDIWGEVVLDF
jgi:hypothetical protein